MRRQSDAVKLPARQICDHERRLRITPTLHIPDNSKERAHTRIIQSSQAAFTAECRQKKCPICAQEMIAGNMDSDAENIRSSLFQSGGRLAFKNNQVKFKEDEE